MARKLYIADCHFFHGALNYNMDKRGFATEEDLDEYMIRQWNSVVGPRDEVYIIGDFSFAKAGKTATLLPKLKGKLYLIKGNHDHYLKNLDEESLARFEWVKSYTEVVDSGRKVVLSHYPVFCYNGQYKRNKKGESNVYMLYGHVHDTRDEKLVHTFIRQTQAVKFPVWQTDEMRPLACQMINCFTMFSDYKPQTLSQWIETDRIRREKLDALMPFEELSMTDPADDGSPADASL